MTALTIKQLKKRRKSAAKALAHAAKVESQAFIPEETSSVSIYRELHVRDVKMTHCRTDAFVHYAFSIVYTQPADKSASALAFQNSDPQKTTQRKNRSIKECERLFNKFAQLMCQTFIAKRDFRRHARDKVVMTAFHEDKSLTIVTQDERLVKRVSPTKAHHHAILSIHRKFAPLVDQFCNENFHKNLYNINRVLPRAVATSHMSKLNSQQEIDAWLFYSTKFLQMPAQNDSSDSNFKVPHFSALARKQPPNEMNR